MPDGKSFIYSNYAGQLIFPGNEVMAGYTLSRYSLKTGKSIDVTDIFGGYSSSPDPDVSPNGRLLAFTRGVQGKNEIRLHRLGDGKDWRFPSVGQARSASFSPDGKRIAYTRQVGGHWELFTSRLDGKKTRQLTNDGRNKINPAFSPDGTRIAYGYLANFPEPSGPGNERMIFNLRSGKTSKIIAPGRAVGASQWTRSKLFEVRGYRRGKRQVVVRVFNPGTVTIRGNGIRFKRRNVSRGTYRLKVVWRKNRKASSIKVRFKPLNAYPETRIVKARR